MADLVAARRARLAALRERGVDPFTATRYDVTAHAAELATKYAELPEQGRAESETWSIAGRIMAVRGQGGVIFFDLHDRTGRFQLFVRKNDLSDEAFAVAKELERGDIAGATGFVFRTKAGDLSLYVRSFEVLGKSLQPLPDKWHGLQDAISPATKSPSAHPKPTTSPSKPGAKFPPSLSPPSLTGSSANPSAFSISNAQPRSVARVLPSTWAQEHAWSGL